ncbi:MAG: hypothetical protein OWS74_03940, partial [Firmicutes bacterium]|nr:hypothetical protein [Bacillota bacterium]
ANGFLFHFHAVEALWFIAAGWSFWRGSLRAGWIFAVLMALTSQVSVTYLVPLGLLVFLWGRRRSGVGLIFGGLMIYGLEMAAVGSLGWLGIVLHKIGIHSATAPSSGPVAAPTPLNASAAGISPVAALWHTLVTADWMNIGPSGALGVLSPIGLILGGSVLAESALLGGGFSLPGPANIAAYAPLTVGTIAVLSFLAGRRFRGHQGIAAVAAIGAMIIAGGWDISGWKGFAKTTALPPAQTARVLYHAAQKIPAHAVVIASQGIMGAFSQRRFIYRPSSVPSVLPSSSAYAVIVPAKGIEMDTPSRQYAQIGYLAMQAHAQLIAHRHGVWIFHWKKNSR